jgi:hypothetical protein
LWDVFSACGCVYYFQSSDFVTLHSLLNRWNSCDVDDPYVMDPASGYNNLFISGIKGRDHMEVWREFASKVDSLDLRGQLNPMK